MTKYYSRRTLNSLDELDREQAKIRKRYTSMERHFLESVLQPEKIAYTIGSNLVGKLVSGKKRARQAAGARVKPHLLSPVSAGCRGRSVLKSMMRSWLRWQAFNIAFFVGKKTVTWIWQRHKEKNK